ncbi:MAG: biotin/lipoate--protein ligase family protein [Hyphomicrobiaceae bacterium]
MPSPPRRRPASELDLPPPFSLVTLREVGDAFAHAKAIAADAGAGTLVHVGRFDLSEFAVVLEPEEPLASARWAFYVGMVALYDALVAHAPPDRPIDIRWPDAIYVDGGLIGGGRLAWPAGTDDAAEPDWLVFGATVRLVSLGKEEAGLRPLATALTEEGFDDVGSGRLAESFARHLMLALDAWRAGGPQAVTRTFLDRLRLEKGAIPALGPEGDLLVRWRGKGEPDRHALADALANPSWLDPSTGGPHA